VEGEVLAQFVVNADGTVDVSTFKVVKSSHELFTQSVRNALPNMRYQPAMVGDRAVRQLVQSPFTYSIRK
jgi:protein TonB